jgi:hypothetical protein
MHVPNACTHISKVPHVRAIMRLQDVAALEPTAAMVGPGTRSQLVVMVATLSWMAS